MKILWLDINSSYSHSSVALPAIHAQVAQRCDWEWCVVRGTINDSPGAIAVAVAEQKPDIIAVTFWLFTHRMQIEILSRTVELLDGVKVVCGGPEFLGDNEDFLRRYPFVTAVLRGEGEEAFPLWLDAMEDPASWEQVPGLCWISREDGAYHDQGIARVAEFAKLKYPEESPFFHWDKPFVQLETTRGCFNTCAFCVSGGEKPIRSQSLDQVRARLENIHSRGIKDIRVLDRTFNYDSTRALQMLELFEQYSGDMRFHLEIHPSLMTEALKEKLATLPEGLLHLEAGIQSLNADVLAECGRKGSLSTSLDGLGYLTSLDNVQTHADLIAGLPLYTFDMLVSDIVRLVGLGVDELQIESLKVLPGTRMRLSSREKGLKYSPLPPYEILSTPDISPAELRRAMQISRMVDFYYNSSPWQQIIRKMILEIEGFLPDFTRYLEEIMVLDSPLSLERRGVILYEYCQRRCPDYVDEVSIAWIRGGFSLKKSPAGNVVKVKDVASYLPEGSYDPTCRYYLFTSRDRRIIFGYDSQVHQGVPTIVAYV